MPSWSRRRLILPLSAALLLLALSPVARASGAADELPGDGNARIVLARPHEQPTITISDSDLFAPRERLDGVQPRAAASAIWLSLERDLFGSAAVVPPEPSTAQREESFGAAGP